MAKTKENTYIVVTLPKDETYKPGQLEASVQILRHAFRAELVSFDSSDNYLEELLAQAEAKRTTYDELLVTIEDGT